MRTRLWRIGAPILLIVTVVALLGIWPALRSRNAANERIEAANAEILSLEATAGILAPLALGTSDLENQLVTIESLVPSDHDVAGFVVELDAIASGVGIELRDVVPTHSTELADDPTTPPGWSSVTLAVRVVGKYIDIIHFVDALQGTDRLVVVERISVATGAVGMLVGDLELRVFSTDIWAIDGIARMVDGGEGP